MESIRTCIACRKKNKKKDLIRIVQNNNIAILDKLQKENKRGIYICNNKECINKLIKMKNREKVLKIKVSEESLLEVLKNLEE